MEITLSEVVADLNRNKKTGILSIAIRGDAKNLLKFFFKDGDVYHLTCSDQKDTDCLRQFETLDFLSCSFLPNAKYEASQSTNLPPTSEIIRILEKKTAPVEVANFRIKTATASVPDIATTATSVDFVKIREALKVALTRQIGPVGGKVLTKIIDKKWSVPSPTKVDLQKLLDLLKDEIEDKKNQDEFVKDAEQIISDKSHL